MTASPATASDVLRWPVIGPFLRWRHARTSLQLTLLFAALVIVVHGLLGPQLAPANLATVATWVHYRGLLVIALLAAGNLFCTGCPFVLARDGARRLHQPGLRWPRWLRTKWIGIGLFVAVLFTYELFDLWALPRATAYLVIGYFLAAVAVDLFFAGAVFCKYLCPIGQFNFAASTMSPLELRVRQPETCRTCRTADCVKGRRDAVEPARVVQRGCELGLFLPAKVGNMDCTFCLDCVHACPEDNVALAARVPGMELVEAGRRSGVGWLTRRPDLAALAVIFTFGAMLNAFAMVSPVYALEQWLGRAMGVVTEAPVLAVIFVAALGVVPAVLIGGAAAATAALSRPRVSVWGTAVAYAYALVPVGFGVWLAHYAFHLLTGAATIVPVAQSAAADLFGTALLGAPQWTWTGMRPGAVFPLQLGFILLGTMGSLGVAYLISERDHPRRALPATVPWAALMLVLAIAAIWTLMQPMEMRGVGPAG